MEHNCRADNWTKFKISAPCNRPEVWQCFSNSSLHFRGSVHLCGGGNSIELKRVGDLWSWFETLEQCVVALLAFVYIWQKQHERGGKHKLPSFLLLLLRHHDVQVWPQRNSCKGRCFASCFLRKKKARPAPLVSDLSDSDTVPCSAPCPLVKSCTRNGITESFAGVVPRHMRHLSRRGNN